MHYGGYRIRYVTSVMHYGGYRIRPCNLRNALQRLHNKIRNLRNALRKPLQDHDGSYALRIYTYIQTWCARILEVIFKSFNILICVV